MAPRKILYQSTSLPPLVINASVSLTGISGTTGIGTFSPEISYSVSGISSTGSTGSFVPGVSSAITGISSTSQVGSYVPFIFPTFSGVSSSGQAGSFGIQGDASPGLTGVSGTAIVASSIPTILPTISGISGTSGVGSFGIRGDASPSLSGTAGTAGTGSPTPTINITLAGVTGTGQVGQFTVVGADVAIDLIGVGSSGQVGNLAPSLTIELLAAAAATGTVGNLLSAVFISPLGVYGVGQAGNLSAGGQARDIDAVITKKQLDAIRKKLKKARAAREAEEHKRDTYAADLRRSIEELFYGVTEEQREELVSVLPRTPDDDTEDIQPVSPMGQIDWQYLINHQSAINDLRDVLASISFAVDNEQKRLEFEREEEDIAILLLAE